MEKAVSSATYVGHTQPHLVLNGFAVFSRVWCSLDMLFRPIAVEKCVPDKESLESFNWGYTSYKATEHLCLVLAEALAK